MVRKQDNPMFSSCDPERIVRNPPDLGTHPIAILCAGGPERVRTVATTWAGFVTYWGQPSAVMLSRTSRYVREFCEQHKRVSVSVLPGSRVPELRAGSSAQGPLPQTPIASVKPVALEGNTAFDGAELVLSCKLAMASELSEKLREQLAPTKGELKRLGRQTAIIAYIEHAWRRA